MSWIMKGLRWLDENAEKTIMFVAYMTMATIIFVEVILRFGFKFQHPWSTYIPIYLFVWVTWLGAAYNVKIRTHLQFTEVRLRLPYNGQFACLVLDAVCWIGFALIVINFTIDQVVMVRKNFAVVQGTDDIMQWWFYSITPIAWTLIIVRTLQNLWDDWKTYRRREPFKLVHSILGD